MCGDIGSTLESACQYDVQETLLFPGCLLGVSDSRLRPCGRGGQPSIKHVLPFRGVELSLGSGCPARDSNSQCSLYLGGPGD